MEINTILDILQKLEDIEEQMKTLMLRIDKLEEITNDKYCFWCKTEYSKTILECCNCNRKVCYNCAITYDTAIYCPKYCPRKCCVPNKDT